MRTKGWDAHKGDAVEGPLDVEQGEVQQQPLQRGQPRGRERPRARARAGRVRRAQVRVVAQLPAVPVNRDLEREGVSVQ